MTGDDVGVPLKDPAADRRKIKPDQENKGKPRKKRSRTDQINTKQMAAGEGKVEPPQDEKSSETELELRRQLLTQVSLLAQLTDYIQLHGINSADFSTLCILQRREESERTRDERRHFKQLRLSSVHRGSLSHLCRCTSDRPDKSSKFLSDRTLFYKNHIRAVRGFTAGLSSRTEVHVWSQVPLKTQTNRAHPAFHNGLRGRDG